MLSCFLFYQRVCLEYLQKFFVFKTIFLTLPQPFQLSIDHCFHCVSSSILLFLICVYICLHCGFLVNSIESGLAFLGNHTILTFIFSVQTMCTLHNCQQSGFKSIILVVVLHFSHLFCVFSASSHLLKIIEYFYDFISTTLLLNQLYWCPNLY